MRRFPVLALLLLCAAVAFAQEGVDPLDLTDWSDDVYLGFQPGIELNSDDAVSARESLEFLYTSPNFMVVAQASMNNDGKYGPDIANTPDGTFFGNYFLMDAGGMAFHWQDFKIRMGRLPQYDEVDSPYSVFISSLGHAANTIELRYEHGIFIYETRWIELNSGSSNTTPAYDGETWPDRGAQLKTYALDYGYFKFGMQDFSIYTGRSFDFEYLVNPLPGYLIQYVKGTDSRPWSTGVNENYAVGFFAIWEPADLWTLDGQFFLDDGNTYWIAPESTPHIPFKLAWTFGARKQTPIGRFGFHTAGAFKYTFQSTLEDYPYSYTYYPDTRYWYDYDGDNVQDADEYETIDPEDMYIGYRNGENNIAFLGEYEGKLAGFCVGAELEYVVTGTQSPTNPWAEASESDIPYDGTEWLNEWPLEHKIKLTAKASKRFGKLLAYGSITVGYVWNKLNLATGSIYNYDDSTDLVDAYSYIYKPTDGDDEPIFLISIGGRYKLDFKVKK